MLRAAPAAPAAGCFRARFPKRFDSCQKNKSQTKKKKSEGKSKTTGALTHATGAAKRRTGLVLVRPEQEYNGVICCIMSFFGVLRRYVENGAGASKWVGRDDRSTSQLFVASARADMHNKRKIPSKKHWL